MLSELKHASGIGRGLASLMLIGLSISVAVGCNSTRTGPGRSGDLELSIALKSNVYATLIAMLELTVQYPGNAEPLFFELTRAGNDIDTSLELDVGDSVVITLSAYDSSGTLLYEGADTLDILPGTVNDVAIVLVPQVVMLRPSPISQSAAASSTTPVTVGVDLYNVGNVFGAAFRITYDSTVVQAVDVRLGDFLGSNVLPITRLGSGFVAVGITKKAGETGSTPVDGAGRLAEIDFTPVAEGATALTFSRESVSITDPSGAPVVADADLVLESGEIIIQ